MCWSCRCSSRMRGGEPSDQVAPPTAEKTNDELAQPADEVEPVEDSHDILATPEAAAAEDEPAEGGGETTNPYKSRRKPRRPASSIS